MDNKGTISPIYFNAKMFLFFLINLRSLINSLNNESRTVRQSKLTKNN